MNNADGIEKYWLHDLSPFLIQFSENFGIRYYGLAYALAFVIAAFLLAAYHKRGLSPLNKEQQTNTLFFLILGVMVGGRFGYFLFYEPLSLIRDPLSLVQVWKGGMASHGGFIGVTIAVWLIARKTKIHFLHLGDLIASLAPPGLLLGRIANFINGELWGKPSSVDWAVRFPDAPDGGIEPRHPSQLYEAFLEGGLMLAYTQWRLWKSPVLKHSPGQLSGEFLLGYSIARIIGEQFREPDLGVALTFGFLSRGSTLSLLMALTGVSLIVYAKRNRSQL